VHHHKKRLHVCEGVGSGVGTDVVGGVVAGADVSGAEVAVGAEVEVPGAVPVVADCSSLVFFLSFSEGDAETEAAAEGDSEASGESVAEASEEPDASSSGFDVSPACEDAEPSAGSSPAAAGFGRKPGPSVPSSARLSPPAARTKPAAMNSVRRRGAGGGGGRPATAPSVRGGLAVSSARATRTAGTTLTVRAAGTVRATAPLGAAPTAPTSPPGGPSRSLLHVVVLVQRVGVGRVHARFRVYVGLLRRGAELFGWGAAPRAGKGAVEVPSAREAVVHDAGRLSSSQVTFIGTAVKVV